MTLVRSFVAIDFGEVQAVKKIEEVERELMRLGLDAKFVERENLHITLRFLGEIPATRVEEAARSLSTLKFAKFQVQLSGLGVFPDLERPRVIWVGVSKGVEELKRLAEIVRNLVDKYAAHEEDKEFKPHLTIARIKSGRGVEKLREFIKQMAAVDFGSVVVDKVKLKKSVLTPRGPIYSDIFVQNLT